MSLSGWYDRRAARFVPRYALFSLLFCVVEISFYSIAKLLIFREPHNIMSALDAAIPLRAEWSVVYFGCFVFWAVNFCLIARGGKEQWYRFFAAHTLAEVVSAVIFVLYPTTMTRPEIVGEGFFAAAMRLMYAADTPLNLLPSLHCLVSWECFIGLWGNRSVPRWYKAFSGVFAVLVFLSTLFVRQHCVVDVVTGVALAQVCNLLFRRGSAYRVVERVFDRLDKLVFKA